MKKSFKLAALFAAMLTLVFTGCKKETPTDDLEAFIKSISITNAGISGGSVVNGEVDNTAMVVTFNDVPAETNIAAVKLSGKYSLGAKLENDVLDLTAGNDASAKTLESTIKVVNKTDLLYKEENYKVIVNLSDPVSAPVLEKIIVKDDKGTEVTLTSTNVLDGLLCLGVPESSTATIVDVQLSPARATYEFTTAVDGVLSSSNSGVFKMDFMGLTAEYEVTFSASPTPGVDWSKAVVHDFSIVTGNVYADFAEGELTRGGDFDGNYVLLAHRTEPKLFAVEDLLNNSVANPTKLDVTGIEGGTYAISAGRLTQGHIYICNLCAVPADWEAGLKVYHYATPTSAPEVVLHWDGTGVTNDTVNYTGRLGDNISISLDESGNGYAFFFKQEADQKFYRFTVTNFTSFSDPTVFSLPAISNYYGMMNPVGDNQYLFKCSYKEMMWLMDADGNLLLNEDLIKWKASTNGADPSHACDPRVIEINRARYLMMMNAHRFGWWADEALNVYDITEGNDIVSALVKLDEAIWPKMPEDAEEEPESTLEPVYSYPMASGQLASACVALCNTAERDGKLLIWAAAPYSGMCLVEVPKY